MAEIVRHSLTNHAVVPRQGTSIDAVKFHIGNIHAGHRALRARGVAFDGAIRMGIL